METVTFKFLRGVLEPFAQIVRLATHGFSFSQIWLQRKLDYTYCHTGMFVYSIFPMTLTIEILESVQFLKTEFHKKFGSSQATNSDIHFSIEESCAHRCCCFHSCYCGGGLQLLTASSMFFFRWSNGISWLQQRIFTIHDEPLHRGWSSFYQIASTFFFPPPECVQLPFASLTRSLNNMHSFDIWVPLRIYRASWGSDCWKNKCWWILSEIWYTNWFVPNWLMF